MLFLVIMCELDIVVFILIFVPLPSSYIYTEYCTLSLSQKTIEIFICLFLMVVFFYSDDFESATDIKPPKQQASSRALTRQQKTESIVAHFRQLAQSVQRLVAALLQLPILLIDVTMERARGLF